MELFARLPTAALGVTVDAAKRPDTNDSTITTAAHTNTNDVVVRKRPRPSGVLNPDAARALWAYIDGRKAPRDGRRRAKPGTTTGVVKTLPQRSKELVRIPEAASRGASTTSSSFMDAVNGKLGALGIGARALTLEVLVQNHVWVHRILAQCHVSMTDLWDGGLVTSLHDLLRLQFTLEDLQSHTTLFNVNTLDMFYEVHYDELRAAGLECSPLALRDFTSGELETLQFSFDTLLRDHADCNASRLRQFRLPLQDMKARGFEQRHAQALAIDRDMALGAQPDGFGWDAEEYERFLRQ